jgi:hypothetical protein
MNPDTDYSIAATISDMAAAVVRQTRIINSRRSDAPKLTISL